MMDSFIAGALSAVWLGVLTSISPCPLATNIAAISFIGKRVGSISSVLLSGMLYTAGRVLTYLAVGMIVVFGLLSIPEVSMFLQKYMHKLLGPVLVVAGLLLLD
ncbi:MAG: urease accessory protein UreH domain-containing protein, partial [Candidatus Latescibacterota bacterium]